MFGLLYEHLRICGFTEGARQNNDFFRLVLEQVFILIERVK